MADLNKIIQLEVQRLVAQMLAGFYAKLDAKGLQNSLLRQSIAPGEPTFEISETGGITTITVNLPDYYKYIDKGVKGAASTYPGAGTSPYQYKTKWPNRKMANSIAKWITSKGVSIYDSKAKQASVRSIKDKSRRQASISKLRERRSYQIASSVKQKGIRPTMFFTDTIESGIFETFAEKLAKLLGRELLVNFKVS